MTAEEVKILLKIQADASALVDVQRDFVRLRESMGSITQMGKLGGVFSAAGLGLQGFSQRVEQAIGFTSQLAAQIERNENRLKLASEASQVYGRVLSEAGSSVDDFAAGMKNANKLIGEAEQGSKTATATLKQYGLQAALLARLSPESRMDAMAKAVMALPTVTQRAAAAQDLFGKSGDALLPLLERLSKDGYGALKAQVEQTAGLLSGDLASALNAAATDVQRAENKLGISLGGVNLALQKSRASVAEFAAEHWRTFAAGGIISAVVSAGAKFNSYAAQQNSVEAAVRRQVAATDAQTAALQRQEQTLGALAAAEGRLQLARTRAVGNGIDPRTGIKSASESASVFMLAGAADQAATKVGVLRMAVQGLGSAFKSILLSPFTWITVGGTAFSAAINAWENSMLGAIMRADAAMQAAASRMKTNVAQILELRSESDRKSLADKVREQIGELEAKKLTQVLRRESFYDKEGMVTGRSGWATREIKGLSEDQKFELAALQKQLAYLESDKPAGQIKRNQEADAAAARLDAAKKVTEELKKQADTYDKQRDANRYALASDEEKLGLLTKELSVAAQTYEKDLAAARLTKDTVAETAALAKYQAAVLGIADKRATIEKTISDEKARQAKTVEDELKKYFAEVEKDANRLAIQQSDDAIKYFATQRSKVDGNPYLTEGEARRARIDLLQKENAEIARQIELLKSRQRLGGDNDALQGQIRQLGERSSANELEIGRNAEPIRGLERFRMQLRQTGEDADNTFDLLDAGFEGLSGGIMDAMANAKNLGDAFKRVFASMGSAIAQAMQQLVAMRIALAVFGFLGLAGGAASAASGAASGATAAAAASDLGAGMVSGVSSTPALAMAGGGSFVTRGVTRLTVGDNPGGRELVSVIPLSGAGRSTFNGRDLRMAGGGMALIEGAAAYSPSARGGLASRSSDGGDRITVVVEQHIAISTGVQETVRAEIIGFMPQFRGLAEEAVSDGIRRGRIQF